MAKSTSTDFSWGRFQLPDLNYWLCCLSWVSAEGWSWVGDTAIHTQTQNELLKEGTNTSWPRWADSRHFFFLTPSDVVQLTFTQQTPPAQWWAGKRWHPPGRAAVKWLLQSAVWGSFRRAGRFFSLQRSARCSPWWKEGLCSLLVSVFFMLHSRIFPQTGLYVQISCIPYRPVASCHCCH